jgi:hypothetical protein
MPSLLILARLEIVIPYLLGSVSATIRQYH